MPYKVYKLFLSLFGVKKLEGQGLITIGLYKIPVLLGNQTMVPKVLNTISHSLGTFILVIGIYRKVILFIESFLLYINLSSIVLSLKVPVIVLYLNLGNFRKELVGGGGDMINFRNLKFMDWKTSFNKFLNPFMKILESLFVSSLRSCLSLDRYGFPFQWSFL